MTASSYSFMVWEMLLHIKGGSKKMKKTFFIKLIGLMVLLVPLLFKFLNIIESINATILVITILLGIAILVLGDYLGKKDK